MNKKQIDELLETMIVCVDSREKSNFHVLDTFDKYNVKYEKRKLDSGDYCAYIPADGVILKEDLWSNIVIERKSGLDELSQNLSKNRERFKREFARCDKQIILMIENNTYSDICNHNYKSQLLPKQFLALLHSFVVKYGSSFVFIEDKKVVSLFIYKTMYYELREQLKYL